MSAPLLLNKSCVGQIVSSTAAVNDNPPTGIEFCLDLFYILKRFAEKMFQLIGHALEKNWAIWRGGPGTVIVLNVDNNVQSCGVSPRVKLKLIGLDSPLHGSRCSLAWLEPTTPVSSYTCPTAHASQPPASQVS